VTSARFDMHLHSSQSDGTCEPAAVAALAAEAGLAGMALTDHDTVAGWDEAAAACARLGLEFVPGIELSAEAGGRSVHLLGYWVDGDDPGLVAECARLRRERERRALAILERLAALGVVVAADRVRAIAGDAPIGRPHVAAAIVETGAVADLDEAFDRYLADGRPACEPKRALDPADAVALLRAAGGVAVLAHPGCTQMPGGLVDRLVDAGLAGVECEHPGHEPGTTAHWFAEAARLNLVPTGASDFHGDRKEVKIGEHATSAVAVDDLRTRRGSTRVHKTSAREDSPW
jgi:hypothetical protein